MPDSSCTYPMHKEGEMIELSLQDIGVQPGYTINLEELFGNHASYSVSLSQSHQDESNKENLGVRIRI